MAAKCMALAQANESAQKDAILKSNLWKFFKTLRVQANPLYCLLAASPCSCAWITLAQRSAEGTRQRISVAQFLGNLSRHPSAGWLYQLHIRLYDPACGEILYTAASRPELQVERIEPLLSAVVGALCAHYKAHGKPLELTPATIHRFKLKARYLDELQPLFEQANHALGVRCSAKKTEINDNTSNN